MEINLTDIKSMCSLLIDTAIKSDIDTITADIDYYWRIAPEERVKFDKAPSEMHVGSLEDDLSCLYKVLNRTWIPTVVDFDRLGNLFIAIGQCIADSDKIMQIGD